MIIDNETYQKVIDENKRTEYQRGFDDGMANKRVDEYKKGYDDGVKDVFMTLRRAFSDNLEDIWKGAGNG